MATSAPPPATFPHSFGAVPFELAPQLPYSDLMRLEHAMKRNGSRVPNYLKDACRKAAWAQDVHTGILQAEPALQGLAKTISAVLAGGPRAPASALLAFASARTSCERALVEFASLVKASTDSLASFVNQAWGLALPATQCDFKHQTFRDAFARAHPRSTGALSSLVEWLRQSSDGYTQNLQNFRNRLVHDTSLLIVPWENPGPCGVCPIPKRLPISDDAPPPTSSTHWKMSEILQLHLGNLFTLLRVVVRLRTEAEQAMGSVDGSPFVEHLPISGAPYRDYRGERIIIAIQMPAAP